VSDIITWSFASNRIFFFKVHVAYLNTNTKHPSYAQQNPSLFLKSSYGCPQNTSGSDVLEVYNGFKNYLKLLHKQQDKNHNTEYMTVYISSATYNICDLYNLLDPTNYIYIYIYI
jgi:hypothetical protein